MSLKKYLFFVIAFALAASAAGCDGVDEAVGETDSGASVTVGTPEITEPDVTSEATAPLADGQMGFHNYTVPVKTYGRDDSDVGSAAVTLTYNSAVYTRDDIYLDNISVVRCDEPDITEGEIFNWCYSGYAREYSLTITEELKPDGYRNYDGKRFFHGFEDQTLIDAYGADRDAELRARREYMYLLKLQEGTYLMLSYCVPDSTPAVENEGEHYDNVAARAVASIEWDRSAYSEYLLDCVDAMIRHNEFYVSTALGQCTFSNESGTAGERFVNAMQTDKWLYSDDETIEPDYERLNISVRGYRITATERENVIAITTPRMAFTVRYSVPEGTVDTLAGFCESAVSERTAMREAQMAKMCTFMPEGAVGLEYINRIWSLDDYLLCYRMEDGGVSVWRAESLGTSFHELTLREPDGVEYDRAEVMFITAGGGSGEYLIYVAYYRGERNRDTGRFMTGEDTRYFVHYGAGREDAPIIESELSEQDFLETYGYYNPHFDSDHGKYYTELTDAELSNADNVHILASTEFNGKTVAVVKDGTKILAATVDHGKYYPFYTISEGDYAYEGSIVIEPFYGVLEHDGVHLNYVQGANAAANCFFVFDDDIPELLFECGKSYYIDGNCIITQNGTWGQSTVLHSFKNGTVASESLNGMMVEQFPNAKGIYVYYHHSYVYEEHKGLFIVDVWEDENYVGWLEGGELYLMPENEMTLPEYTYVPAKYTTAEAGKKWLIERFDTDFALWDEIDPTTLDEAALEAYMNEAFCAASSVLFGYSVDSGFLIYDPIFSYTVPEIYYCNGSYYEACNNPAFPTLSAWENYMRRIFSNEIAEKYLQNNTFAEIDGELYCQSGARGSGASYTSSKITAITDTDITYTVYVKDHGDGETNAHEFHYSKTDDGWRWTVIYSCL